MRCWLIAVVLFSAAAAGAENSYQSAGRKITLIQEDRAAPGSRIWLSIGELNDYVRHEAIKVVPQGLRNPRLELGHSSAAAYALIDFLKVRELKGAPPSLLLVWLLSGERPVRVTAQIQSSQGRATVNVEEVDMAGISARGAVLDFLIDNFFLPFYPEAKIGRPFELGHNVDRLEVSPQGVSVVMAGKPVRR